MSTVSDPSKAVQAIHDRAPGFVPRMALVLGSGLGPLADKVENAVALSYADLPGFPEAGVEGHAGRLVLGTLSGVAVACLQGRAHAYEAGLAAMRVPVRTMKLLGAELLYLTCAAGSLRQEVEPTRLMTITDHINLMGGNPLVGRNDPEVGPRFPPLVNAYDPDLVHVQRAAALDLGIDLAAGVYCGWLGPTFETPAEIRMMTMLGADAVGMSTVPECILARHCGLKVSATAVITNYAVGISPDPVDHAQTLAGAKAAEVDFQRFILKFVERYSNVTPVSEPS